MAESRFLSLLKDQPNPTTLTFSHLCMLNVFHSKQWQFGKVLNCKDLELPWNSMDVSLIWDEFRLVDSEFHY